MTKRVTKESFGLICCRYNKPKNALEVMVIKKRCTYSFIEFVLGHYSKNGKNGHRRIRYLFNHMTLGEKIDIKNMDFGVLWNRIWLVNPNHMYSFNTFYEQKKKHFCATFCHDGGVLLTQLLNNTYNADTLWEAPKGKRNPLEADIECAVREFREETGIKKNKYTLLADVRPMRHTYLHSRVQYNHTYFAALCLDDRVQKKDMRFKSREQMIEVMETRWATLKEINVLDPSGRLAKVVEPVIKIVKKRYLHLLKTV